MGKKPKTFSLSPEKLAHLFTIGSDLRDTDCEINRNQKRAELLCDRLEQSLPVDPAAVEVLPKALGKQRNAISAIVGYPIGKMLYNQKTNLSLLKKIKDYGKKLSKCADSQAEHDTANAIYYAAIAGSILYHDRRISKFSYKDLGCSFDVWSQKNWIPRDLRNLFAEASQYCENKIKTNG